MNSKWFAERDRQNETRNPGEKATDMVGGCKQRNEEIAVLVLNRDGARFLEDCFSSLLRITDPPFEIYLIDNDSQDSSIELTCTMFPTVNIIRHDSNLGFAGAYDRVIRKLHHQYVVLLNNDTTVHPNWLRRLVDTALSDPKIAACGSKILMMWNPRIIDHAGGMLTAVGSGLDRGKWRVDTGQYDVTTEIGFACGCSLLIDREAYLHVGGFDPDYIIYHEDVDLCWKMHLCGYKVVYVHDSIVYHWFGGGRIQSAENPWKLYLCQKNRLANILKNSGIPQLFFNMIISLLYDMTRMTRFVLARRIDLIMELINAYRYSVSHLDRFLQERRHIQQCRHASDAMLNEFFCPVLEAMSEYYNMVILQNSHADLSRCANGSQCAFLAAVTEEPEEIDSAK